MSGSFLTAEEIYAIDDVSEKDFLAYLSEVPEDKRDLVSHIFSKNREIEILRVISDEVEENSDRLRKMLQDNGIQV